MLVQGQFYRIHRKDGIDISSLERTPVVFVDTVQGTHVVIRYGKGLEGRMSLFRDNYIFYPLSSLEKELL